jgi:hypothetical protein
VYTTYALQTHWAWDNSHEEWTTFDIEDFEQGFECLLNDPESITAKYYLEMLQKRANFITGSGNPSKLVRLWKVGKDSSYKLDSNLAPHKATLTLPLEPLIDFDDSGNPCPIRK